MAQFTYGIHAVDALLRRRPASISRLCVQVGRNDKRINALLELAQNQGVRVERLSKDSLGELADGRHQGVVAEFSAAAEDPVSGESGALQSEEDLWQHLETLERVPLLLVLDGVTDPHNLGACLRSADAAGVDAVILPKDKSAAVTPTVRKVACGAAEVIPVLQVTNLARALDALKARGVWLYGAAGEAQGTLYDQDLTLPLAIVMGSEGSGLRRLTREHCDVLVRLPMAGSVSSLNVSVATGICLYEVVRQRLRV